VGDLVQCQRCGMPFLTADALERHFQTCSGAAAWQDPRFREVRAVDPPTNEPRFGQSTFDFGDDPRVAAETQRERVDGALRSGRIPSEAWEPEQPQPSRWRRIWNRIRG
jgi:hypothetical protein